MFILHRGQSSRSAAVNSVRFIAAPQWEQNFAPWNIIPKQDGHAMVASRAPQCSHFVALDEADAPHIGQFSVSAGMVRVQISMPSRYPILRERKRLCAVKMLRGLGNR